MERRSGHVSSFHDAKFFHSLFIQIFLDHHKTKWPEYNVWTQVLFCECLGISGCCFLILYFVDSFLLAQFARGGLAACFVLSMFI